MSCRAKPLPRPCPWLLRVVAVHWKAKVFLSRVRFLVWLYNLQPQVTPFLQQAKHRRKWRIPSFIPSSHLARGYSLLERAMWLQWLVARSLRQAGTRVKKVSFNSPLDHSPMAPVSLGCQLSSHTCGLVVTCSTTNCIKRSFLSHLVHLSGLTITESLHSLSHVLWRPIKLYSCDSHSLSLFLSPSLSFSPSHTHLSRARHDTLWQPSAQILAPNV